MNHLSQEDLVLTYYREAGSGPLAQHLASCETCRTELDSLAAILDRVTPVEVPEPAEDYEERVWSRLQWRIRGDKKRERFAWLKSALIAAAVAAAFLAGLLWKLPTRQSPATVATNTTGTTTPVTDSKTRPADASSRILLVVVGEHFDQSERILVELTNLTPQGDTDITTERERAEELLASNRLYRRTALDRGEEDVATLLDELEPVLLQIAHAPSTVGADELRAIQKRVEAKGLVFKLRVVRADVHRSTGTTTSI